MEALGRHHAFETAIADLVDNSIDAHAQNVLIRFVRRGDRLISLIVVDDGHGMNGKQLDVAMTIGGRRKYGDTDLGRFGLGLKAASFSQAKTLVVASRTSKGSAEGRRWDLNHTKKDFLCGIVDDGFAEGLLDRAWLVPESRSGTVVRWDNVTAFPRVDDPEVVDRFLTAAITDLRAHLGLVFHRLLERKVTEIFIDVEDVASAEVGLRYAVEPLNPFKSLRSGKHGYPTTIVGRMEETELSLECHIWPGRSVAPEFLLPGGPLERQGIYVYLRDRLIQGGGWNGLKHRDKRLNLARIALDIDGDVKGVLTLKPEKTGIEPGPDFAPLVHRAEDGEGRSFTTYLEDAEMVFRESRRRQAQRQAVFPPGRGFNRRLRRAIRGELKFIEGEKPIDIRWARFYDDEFFEVDRDERVIWLNVAYRGALLGNRHGSLNDLPVVKALLYLLFENVFHGQYFGARDKDNLELWQAILTVAAATETG